MTLCTYEFTGKAAFIAICTHIAGDSHILKIVRFCLNDPFARARKWWAIEQYFNLQYSPIIIKNYGQRDVPMFCLE